MTGGSLPLAANRTARLDHSTLCEAEDFQTVRAEIHNIFAHYESSAFCFRVHLCQFLAAMATEGRKIIACDYVQLFQIGFAHRTNNSFVVKHNSLFGSVAACQQFTSPGAAFGQKQTVGP